MEKCFAAGARSINLEIWSKKHAGATVPSVSDHSRPRGERPIMNPRSQAISILQKARDALGERLTQRILESQHEIEADAEGGSYLSEIETIYEQIGGRLAHLNAMLSNLPPADPTMAVDAPFAADATASEIIYADLASAYPAGLDAESTAPLTLLALPAPAHDEEPREESLADRFASIVFEVQSGDMVSASWLISELFDIKPSQARRAAQAFARQLGGYPDLARRIEELGVSLETTNEYAAATLLGECFEFQAIDALALVRVLKTQFVESDADADLDQ